MKYFLLTFSLCSCLVYGQLTKKQEIAWEKYNATKFTTSDKFVDDMVKALKEGLIDVTGDEAECVGYFIARALSDKYDLTKKHTEKYGELLKDFVKNIKRIKQNANLQKNWRFIIFAVCRKQNTQNAQLLNAIMRLSVLNIAVFRRLQSMESPSIVMSGF